MDARLLLRKVESRFGLVGPAGSLWRFRSVHVPHDFGGFRVGDIALNLGTTTRQRIRKQCVIGLTGEMRMIPPLDLAAFKTVLVLLASVEAGCTLVCAETPGICQAAVTIRISAFKPRAQSWQ
jgi:hypothetical protein